MKMNVEEMKVKLFTQKIDPITYTDSTGKKYVLQSDLLKFNLDSSNYKTLVRILQQNSIDVMDEIKKEDRPSRVKDFEYGSITEAKVNPADNSRFINVKYNSKGEIEYVDYTKLDEFLEEKFIPENVHIKIRYKHKECPEYQSIQLNKIVKLQLSELEFAHVMEYLKKQGIIVCGTSEYPEDEFVNFDYFYRLKNIQIPKSLTSEETIELFRKIKSLPENDEEIVKIKEQIINGNMRLAKWVFNGYKAYFELDDDSLSYVYEGLIKAVDRFDVDKGFLFSTFAVKEMRYTLMNYLAKEYDVDSHLFFSFWRAKKIVEDNYGRKFTKSDKEMMNEIFELLYEMGLVSESGISRNIARLMASDTISLDDEQIRNSIYDDMLLMENIENESIREEILKVLDELTEREKNILIYKFGLNGDSPKSLKEIEKIFNISTARIHQIETKAIKKLKRYCWKLLVPCRGELDCDTNPNSRYIEKHMSERDWDYYEGSDQADMSGGVDALEELTRILSQDDFKKGRKKR